MLHTIRSHTDNDQNTVFIVSSLVRVIKDVLNKCYYLSRLLSVMILTEISSLFLGDLSIH